MFLVGQQMNNISIVNKTSSKLWRKYDSDFQLLFNDIMLLHDLNNKEITLILVKDKYIKNINNIYRNKNYATDVITFNDDEQTDYLGDIFINVDAVVRQAKEYRNTVRREINFLLMHGILHSLNYDHINKDDEQIMINKQKEIFKGRKYLDEEI